MKKIVVWLDKMIDTRLFAVLLTICLACIVLLSGCTSGFKDCGGGTYQVGKVAFDLNENWSYEGADDGKYEFKNSNSYDYFYSFQVEPTNSESMIAGEGAFSTSEYKCSVAQVVTSVDNDEFGNIPVLAQVFSDHRTHSSCYFFVAYVHCDDAIYSFKWQSHDASSCETSGIYQVLKTVRRSN